MSCFGVPANAVPFQPGALSGDIAEIVDVFLGETQRQSIFGECAANILAVSLCTRIARSVFVRINYDYLWLGVLAMIILGGVFPSRRIPAHWPASGPS